MHRRDIWQANNREIENQQLTGGQAKKPDLSVKDAVATFNKTGSRSFSVSVSNLGYVDACIIEASILVGEGKDVRHLG